ncbi:MAG: hypothetical protein EOM15_08110 [Spirochaetia bacterium]|nr:hypothetical protein [Spirochaetia bacterium]
MDRSSLRDWAIVGCSILLSILALSSIGKLQIDSSTEAFIPQQAPVVQTNELIKARFGSLDSLVVSLYAQQSMLTKQNMLSLQKLTNEIALLEGVGKVSSLTNLIHLEPSEEGLEGKKLYEGDLAKLRERIDSWPSLYEGTFISSDEQVASVLIQTTLQYDPSYLLAHIQQLLDKIPQLESSILGLASVTEEIEKSLLSDLALLAPIVALLIIIVLFLFLKKIEAVFLSLVPLFFSSCLILGIMAWTGITFTMATMLVPLLLLIVGSAYTIHIFSHFYQDYTGLAIDTTLSMVVRKNTYPILAASATTAFGFLAQLSSPLEPFRTFGLLSFLGVLICALSSLVLLPALIRLVYHRFLLKQPREKTNKKERWVSVLLYVADKKGKLTILISTILVVVLLPLSYANLQRGTNMLDFFKSSSSLVQMNKRYNQKMQGSFALTVMIIPDSSHKVLSVRNLLILEKAIDALEQEESVGGVQSIIPFIKRMNQLLGPSDEEEHFLKTEEPSFDFFSDAMDLSTDGPMVQTREKTAGGMGSYEIPVDPKRYALDSEEELSFLIAQYLLLYSASLDTFINDPLEPDATAFTILLKDSQTDTLQKLSTLVYELFPPTYTVKIGGGEAVSLALTELVTKSQVISLFSSLIAVFLLVLVTLKSVKLAFLSLIPCIFALTSVFTAMVLFSIKLDIITSLLASLCIGIGVDYAIHLLAAFLRNQQTLEQALMTTGRAIMANAASVALGFTGLLFSRFTPIIHLGLLFCIAMTTAALSALVLLPALNIHYAHLYTIRRRL